MDPSKHAAPAYNETPEIAIQQPNGAYISEKNGYNAEQQQQQLQHQQYSQPQAQPQLQMSGPGNYAPAQPPVQYQTATPIPSLGEFPAVIDCPVCGTRQMTTATPETGNTTNAWAAILCICCCLGCIPYLISSLKDVLHRCGHCGVPVARWHRSGRLEPLARQ